MVLATGMVIAMKTSHPRMMVAIASGAMLAGAIAVAQPSMNLDALKLLEPGMWELKERSQGPTMKRMCVADTHALLQVAHEGTVCSRFVIGSESKSVTVHYTCPGAGHGRTTIRVENSHLAQISSQGLVGKDPFNYTLEARRTGNCGGGGRGFSR